MTKNDCLLDMSFCSPDKSGKGKRGDLSFQRLGSCVKWRDGKLILLPNSSLAMDGGVELAGAATNKVTCAKSNPQDLTNITKSGDAAAVLSVVNDADALAAAGLSAFGPNVYKLDNSAGTGASYADFSGATGNTNLHSISVFARGSGGGEIYLNVSGTGLSMTLTPAHVRYRKESITPSSATHQMVVKAVPGAVVYFTLPQLEEGPFCTSPIPGGTGAITRASSGADTSGNGLSIPLSQAMIDSLKGEMIDWSTAGGGDPEIAYTPATKTLVMSGTFASAQWFKAGLTIGQSYEISFTVTGLTTGSFQWYAGGQSFGVISANGTYTQRATQTGNQILYIRAVDSCNGSVTINYVRRVLESGQTNPGEGTMLCGVYLPWASSAIPNDVNIILWTVFNSTTSSRFAIRRNSSVYLSDGVTGVQSPSMEINAGRYLLVSQWSSSLGKMRVGIYNPATGTLTWSHATLASGATYRGFFPIYGTGSQMRLRWGYGLGNFLITLLHTSWYSSIKSDSFLLKNALNLTKILSSH